jgi:hypothetical protein
MIEVPGANDRRQKDTSIVESRERRRHTRHPVSLTARITTPNGKGHAATIQDFCLGGLFVACQALVAEPALDQGARVQVSFVLPVDGRDRRFDVATQVARFFPAGMGLHFFQSDVETLQALRALTQVARKVRKERQAAARLALPSETVVAGVDAHMLDASKALARCKGTVADYLTANVEALYKRTDEKLSKAASDAIGSSEEGRHFHAMWELNNLQSTIHTAFRADILRRLDDLLRPDAPSADAGDGVVDLALADTESFSDWLVVKEILEEATPRTAASCHRFEERLSRVLQTPVDENTNPVGPIGICAAFHDAIHGLWLSTLAREPLFEAFRETVMANLETLYAELNAALDEHTGAAVQQGAAG